LVINADDVSSSCQPCGEVTLRSDTGCPVCAAFDLLCCTAAHLAQCPAAHFPAVAAQCRVAPAQLDAVTTCLIRPRVSGLSCSRGVCDGFSISFAPAGLLVGQVCNVANSDGISDVPYGYAHVTSYEAFNGEPMTVPAGIGALASGDLDACVVGQLVTALRPGGGSATGHHALATIAHMNGENITVDWVTQNLAAPPKLDTVPASSVQALSGRRCRAHGALPSSAVPQQCVTNAPGSALADPGSGSALAIAYQSWMGAVALLALTDRACLRRRLSADYLTLLFDEMYSVVVEAGAPRTRRASCSWCCPEISVLVRTDGRTPLLMRVHYRTTVHGRGVATQWSQRTRPSRTRRCCGSGARRGASRWAS
jgi:hypothetical protein